MANMMTTIKMRYTPRPPATKSPDKDNCDFRKPVWPIAPDGFIPNSVVRSFLQHPKITPPAPAEKQVVLRLRPERPVLRRPPRDFVEERSCPKNKYPTYDNFPSYEPLKLNVRDTRCTPPPAPKPVSKSGKKPVAPNKPPPATDRYHLRNIKLGCYEKLEEHVWRRKTVNNNDPVEQKNPEAPCPAEEETLPITAPEEEIPVEAVSEEEILPIISAEPESEEDSTVPPKTVRRRRAVRAQRPQKLKLPPVVELRKEKKSLPLVVEKEVKVQVQEIRFPAVQHTRPKTQPEKIRSFEPQPPKCHSRRLDSPLMHLYKRSKAAHLVARDAPYATVNHFLHQCHLQKKDSPAGELQKSASSIRKPKLTDCALRFPEANPCLLKRRYQTNVEAHKNSLTPTGELQRIGSSLDHSFQPRNHVVLPNKEERNIQSSNCTALPKIGLQEPANLPFYIKQQNLCWTTPEERTPT